MNAQLRISIVNEMSLDHSGKILYDTSWKNFTAKLLAIRRKRMAIESLCNNPPKRFARFLRIYLYNHKKLFPDGARVLAECRLEDVYKKLLLARRTRKPMEWKKMLFNN